MYPNPRVAMTMNDGTVYKYKTLYLPPVRNIPGAFGIQQSVEVAEELDGNLKFMIMVKPSAVTRHTPDFSKAIRRKSEANASHVTANTSSSVAGASSVT